MRASILTLAVLSGIASAFPSRRAADTIPHIFDSVADNTAAVTAAGFKPIDLNANPFIAPLDTDQRTPCPGINTLLNHGLLPRDGKAIDPFTLTSLLTSVYGLTPIFATATVGAGWARLGNFKLLIPSATDIHILAKHNVIEHDASLGHADAGVGAEFAPVTSDAGLIQDLISRSADGQNLQLEDFAQVRVEREAKAENGGLDDFTATAAKGETALLLTILGDGQQVSTSRIQTFLSESRFPDDFEGPVKALTSLDALSVVNKMKTAMNNIRSQQ